MKILVTIFSFFLFVTTAFAQFDFKCDRSVLKKTDFIGDSLPKPENPKTPSFVDSFFRLEKDYDFQFRFWNAGMMTPSTSVFTLTLRNKKWSARYFKPNLNWKLDGKQLVEIAVDQSKLDQLWELLLMNQILTLPTQSTIKIPMVKYVIDTSNLGRFANGPTRMSLVDGAICEFQLVTPVKSRYFYYDCPQTYLKYYSNIGEFYYAAVIILLINRYVGIADPGC